MMSFVICSEFAVVFLLFSTAKFHSFEIEKVNREIDHLYTNLFQLQSQQNSENYQKNSENILLEIESKLLDNSICWILETAEMPKIAKNEKEKLEKTFEKILENYKKIASETNNSVRKNCEFWKFWRKAAKNFGKNIKMANEKGNFECENKEIKRSFESAVYNAFAEDILMGHLNALSNLLKPKKGEEKPIQMGKAEEQQKDGTNNWNFDGFFCKEKMKNESNFAHFLRKKRIDNNVNGIIEIKRKITIHFGNEFLEKMEHLRPIEMAFDIIDDQRLTDTYAKILQQSATLAEQNEANLTKRMLFGQIIRIFSMANSLGKMKIKKRKDSEKMNKIMSEIEEFWREKMDEIRAEIGKGGNSVKKTYKMWHKLANLFNKIPISKSQQKIGIIYDEFGQTKTEFLWKAKDQMMEEHAKNVAKLAGDGQNELSRTLANSIGQMRGAKHRLKSFFTSKFKGTEILEKLMGEDANFAAVFRSDLTSNEIKELQIKFYLKFLDSESETDDYLRAKLIVDNLAFYQWFKNRRQKLPKNGQSLLEQHLLQIELRLDSIAEIETSEGTELAHEAKMMALKMSKDKLFPEENPTEVKTFGKSMKSEANNVKKTLLMMEMHCKIIEEFAENEQKFMDGVKKIVLDSERLHKMIPRLSKTCQLLKENAKGETNGRKKSNGKNETEKRAEAEKGEANGQRGGECVASDEESDLISCYRHLMCADQPISKSDKTFLMVNSLYFHLKLVINELLLVTNKIKSDGQKNEKMRRKAIEIEVEVQKRQLLAKTENLEQKIAKICYLTIIWEKSISNEFFVKKAKFGEHFWMSNSIKKKVSFSSPAESDENLDFSFCEESENALKLSQHLMNAQSFEVTQEIVLNHLLRKDREFANFVCFNRNEMPMLRKCAEFDDSDQMHRLYLALFASDDSELAFRNETTLAIKLMDSIIAKGEETVLTFGNYKEIAVARAEVRAMAAVHLNFLKEEHQFRIICRQFANLNFLSRKMVDPSAFWLLPIDCSAISREETFRLQRAVLKISHWDFLHDHFDKSPTEDGILRTVRQKRGAFALVAKMIGGEKLLELWEDKGIRAKLMDTNFFNNKNRLLDHYVGALLAADTAENCVDRMREIKANDLIVWTQWFQAKHGEQAEDIQKQMDFLWLYLRITYESYESESDEIFEKIAENMEITRRKLTQMLSSERQNSSNGTLGKSLKNWRDIIRRAFDAWNSAEWDESEGKGQTKRIDDEFVQKMHFEVIRDLCENIHKTDEMVQQKFAKIIKGLTESKECRQNLNSFLKKEQIKKIFEVIGIPFEEKDFENPEQKMEFSSDQSEEKGKETQKKGRKNRRDKNGQKTQNKNEEKWESEKESGEKWTKNEEEKMPKEEKESQKVPKEEKESQKVPIGEEKSEPVPEEEEEELPNTKEFCDENFIFGVYKKYFMETEKTEAEKTIIWVDIMTIGNEIEGQLKGIEEMKKLNFINYFYFMDGKLLENLKEKWQKIPKTKIEKRNYEKLILLREKMLDILNEILTLCELREKNGQKSEANAEKNEKEYLLGKIHRKNLTNAIKMGEFEEKWNGTAKDEKLMNLFKNNYLITSKLGKFRSDAQKMTKQIEIEQILFDRMMAKEAGKELANCLSPSFAKATQQLISDELDKQNSQKLEQFVEERAINGQRTEGKSRKKREKRIKAAINKVKGMVGEWSNHQAKLLISGSFLLGLNTTDSDIDLICVVPGKAIEKEHFFGEPNEICVERECEKGGRQKDTLAQSFYCQLCGNGKVGDLLKITKGQIAMIKFTFDGIDFDISLVAIPKMETLAQRITDRTLKHYVNKFYTENFEHRQMLRVLSSYLSNVHIVKLFDESQKKIFILNDDIYDEKIRQNGRNYENLRFLTLAVKLWAKANFIYSNKFGFLNGVILTIMTSKIVLLYPNSSLRFLLLKFFLIYAARTGGMPIQLEQIEEKSKMSPFLTKNPMENEMKIYTTIFPEQNAARLITYVNAKIIRKAMIEALNKMINSDDWPTILATNSMNFVEKYKTFVAINCLGQNGAFVRNFCQFVEGRIRLQMTYDIGHRGATTNWHIYPALFQETCQITHKLEQIPAKFRSNYHQCKVWLIGSDQSLNGTDQRMINGQLRNFDWAIKRDFLKFNGKLSNKAWGVDIDEECQLMSVTLKSVFVEDLAQLLSSSN